MAYITKTLTADEVIISQNPPIGSGNGGSNERLPSKSALPLHRWTHVSVVSEAAQLRLYVKLGSQCACQTARVRRPHMVILLVTYYHIW